MNHQSGSLDRHFIFGERGCRHTCKQSSRRFGTRVLRVSWNSDWCDCGLESATIPGSWSRFTPGRAPLKKNGKRDDLSAVAATWSARETVSLDSGSTALLEAWRRREARRGRAGRTPVFVAQAAAGAAKQACHKRNCQANVAQRHGKIPLCSAERTKRPIGADIGLGRSLLDPWTAFSGINWLESNRDGRFVLCSVRWRTIASHLV